MQTKNINIDRTPNIEENEIFTDIPEKTLLMLQKQCGALQMGRFEDGYAPPLPPRSSFILGVLPQIPKPQVEVDAGYGPYKPVPPPKPLPQQPCGSNQHQQDCLTPPPYRMPPYPLYNEPSIPGAASGVLEHPIASSSPAGTQGLHTHSSKFPIEREVILSSTDKNSKIPILHDYKKKSKGSVAPDAPPKQMSAWSEGQGHQILPDQTHSGLIQTIQQTGDPNNPTYRSQYHHQEEYYNAQCTGAVPRSSWHGDKSGRPYQEEYTNGNSVETKEMPAKEQKKSMTKTYHTIKDIISSRFKSNKENCEDKEEPGLNNVADDVRKNQGNIAEEEIKKVTEQSHYGKPSTTPSSTTTTNSSQQQQQHTYNQHMIQQHIMAQQQYQVTQQLKSQQYSQQLMQARSQEMLAPRQYDQMYYQGYGSPPPRNQRVPQQQIREQTFVHMEQHVQFVNGNKELPNKDRPQQLLQSERRSAQQLERDNMRQRSFEARRAASQPQLAYDDIPKTEQDNRPQPQMASNQMRRGSHGNIMDTIVQKSEDNDKDSDDGGFLQRLNSKEAPRLPQESKMTENLQGTPRKKLEGEIGKIEGVYNVGQRSSRTEEDIRQLKKANPSSANSSDYDKTGGQSSSNVDSGRGSAAYSSGRRPPTSEINGESLDSNQLNRTVQSQGHDSEWVDIVENELRHILEPKLHELSLQTNPGIANSTLSESISSMTPPLPPLSPGDQSSPNVTPRNSTRYKHSTSLPYGSKPNYEDYKHKGHPRDIASSSRYGNSSQKHRSGKKVDHNAILRGKQIFGLDTTDLTSTTTRSLDLESMLDGQSDSEGDISTTDARTIRKQLEGLESMYSEVLKLLGVNKKMHGKYQPSDPRFSKRRYGSMSSLPSSSVSSRPIRDKRRASEDRKKVRDIRGINKRFQRLESHVVTLARSVAHLSSEMRTQHLMIQEMENIRGEIAALRAQTNMLNVRSQSAARAVSNKELPTLANPSRVKKLTKFFGDEPPLLRLFLRKLGYEKYANVFENERVGMVELPYLSEERLQKMGLPLGPRLRIMQEAQISVCKDNTLCIV